MIQVFLNRPNFHYDVHSLIRAFYPEEEVKVESGNAEPSGEVPLFLMDISFDASENTDFSSSLIRICLMEGETEKLKMESRCSEKDRLETKNELKRMLYRMLSEYSHKELPWGDLTGIRPVKIPLSLLKMGYDEETAASYMQETYYVGKAKTALAVEIAEREKDLLDGLQLSRPDDQEVFQNGYSLYINIPFCPSICLYCSFSSSPIDLWKDRVGDYLKALFREIDAVADLLEDHRPDTVYIGGGTPTTLTPHQMDRLLKKLEERFDLTHLREFTVEAGRPDTITSEKLSVLLSHGVTRISVNPQTMNQETLDFIGRKHTTEQTRDAYDLARSMGFDNINMDLIVGLPGEQLPQVEHTMQVLKEMGPDSITVHSLAVKRAARLRLFKEEHSELTFENSEEIMEMTESYARESGLLPYYLYRQKNMAGNFENVGYARSGCEGLYNILIMEETQSILALGAGASTKLVYPDERIERVENVKDIKTYIERIDEMIERKKAGLYGRTESER